MRTFSCFSCSVSLLLALVTISQWSGGAQAQTLGLGQIQTKGGEEIFSTKKTSESQDGFRDLGITPQVIRSQERLDGGKEVPVRIQFEGAPPSNVVLRIPPIGDIYFVDTQGVQRTGGCNGTLLFPLDFQGKRGFVQLVEDSAEQLVYVSDPVPAEAQVGNVVCFNPQGRGVTLFGDPQGKQTMISSGDAQVAHVSLESGETFSNLEYTPQTQGWEYRIPGNTVPDSCRGSSTFGFLGKNNLGYVVVFPAGVFPNEIVGVTESDLYDVQGFCASGRGGKSY